MPTSSTQSQAMSFKYISFSSFLLFISSHVVISFIKILYKIDEYWLYAKLLSSTDNQSGMIPSTYLNIIDTPDSLNSIIKCNKSAKSFIATADFDPIESGDLKLNKGW